MPLNWMTGNYYESVESALTNYPCRLTDVETRRGPFAVPRLGQTGCSQSVVPNILSAMSKAVARRRVKHHPSLHNSEHQQ
jgi:hypothetical protein